MKKIIGKVAFGVAIGCFAFVSMLFIASVFSGGANAFFSQRSGSDLLTLAVCFIVIAVGFSVPSLVYEKENLSITLKILIHMSIGTVVYLVTAFSAGWIERNAGAIVTYILIAIGIAAIFWGIYMICFRIEAKRINKKIQENQL
ncbi:MAG: DUF3021 domain-containing protein [Eubacteriales bacterium]|nr:DUF3021 domain-containing protein [Eubacteriales bacterium]MDD4583364.1 DUF3021 domain-containing protein [Eubacteriales bacterium]